MREDLVSAAVSNKNALEPKHDDCIYPRKSGIKRAVFGLVEAKVMLGKRNSEIMPFAK
jgi:hypothetical protein